VDIARDRLGYQEYLELRDSIDKNITNAFSKLQKKDGPKVGKKKKKIIDNGDGNGAAPAPVPCPAALGMTPDEDNKLHVSDQLQHLVEIRRQWVDTVGSVFDEKQKENPGRIWGFPPESIYQSVEDEVRMMLLASNPAPGPQVAKAQETSRGDEMDVS
jgi:transcriptional adapter 3